MATLTKILSTRFDYPEAMPDVAFIAKGREVLAHRVFMAAVCPVMASCWDVTSSNWQHAAQPIHLDTSCSYPAAEAFLWYCYTGKVTWPADHARRKSAAELLQLADMFDMPFLPCQVKQALGHEVSVTNCCPLLATADLHAAEQLKRFCTHFTKDAIDLIRQTEDHHSLDPEWFVMVSTAKAFTV